MFEQPGEEPEKPIFDPAARAREKSDEFRMHAEIAAVFEGHRKFDAQFLPKLAAKLARRIQQGMGRLEKSKSPDHPVLPDPSAAEAAELLSLPTTASLSTNDYHIHRRPGEVMIARWLQGPQVETFYQRLQAHFDAALDAFKEDERQAHQWKQDPKTLAYLAALDAINVPMADRYLRDVIRKLSAYVLSTQTADEINISYLCDYVMGASAAEIVGPASAPPEAPTERDLAWFYKLFSLRGIDQGIERMCFFTYLQKSEDTFESDS